MQFPKNFTWGAATAAYQVEGGAREGGRGPSVWDTFSHQPNATWQGHHGDVTCDHFHRWREDIRLMKDLGLKGYRFSLSWSRVIPEGTGRVNAKGLAFYDRLVDALLEAGITPFITLYHWDLPHALHTRGGWLNRESVEWFAAYTTVVAARLGDRVQYWITQNEPQCFVGLGYHTGAHAPGLKLAWPEVLRVGHHALMAHGRAVQALRAVGGKKFNIGYAAVGVSRYPATESARDIKAARESMFTAASQSTWNNAWWTDPMLLGSYPADGWKFNEEHMGFVQDGDMKLISTPIDFMGLNIYSGSKIRAGRNGKPQEVPLPEGHPQTFFQWFITPEVMEWTVRFFHERYGKPIYITENGMSGLDWVAVDGKIHDPQRIDYTTRYLQALGRAIQHGVDVRGYFHWSLMDNLEWAEGYKQRFGLIHVDMATGRRTPKDSAAWYTSVIASNGACLP